MSRADPRLGQAPLTTPISLTKWTAPGPVTKRLALAEDGSIKKLSTAAQLYEGDLERLALTPSQFLTLLTTLGANECLSYALPVDNAAHRVLSRKRFDAAGHPTDAITRTTDKMAWPSGSAVLMGDYDPHCDVTLTRAELLDALYKVCPALYESCHIWGVSTSSCLYDSTSGIEKRGIEGQRVYIVAARGTDIPRAGMVLFKRLCLAGHLHIAISASGSLLVRSIVDSSVWQTNRIDYCAPPICEPPLESRKRTPELLGTRDLALDTEVALPDLTEAEEAAYRRLVEKEKSAAAPKAAIVREAYLKDRIAKLVESGVDPAIAEKTIRVAVELSVLDGNFPLMCADGTIVTVAEVLADRARYHGQSFADPIERDYHDDRRVARAVLLGVAHPYIHSYAHGGCRYRLAVQIETIKVGKGVCE